MSVKLASLDPAGFHCSVVESSYYVSDCDFITILIIIIIQVEGMSIRQVHDEHRKLVTLVYGHESYQVSK